MHNACNVVLGQVFWYSAGTMQWASSCELPGHERCHALAWAPGEGACLAVASGSQLAFHRLSGRADKLQVRLMGGLPAKWFPSKEPGLAWHHAPTSMLESC